MKKFIALLLAAVMVFAMAACAPAAEQDGGKTTYAIVCKDGSNPYMKRMVSGFEAACKELGVEFIEKSPETLVKAVVEVTELMGAETYLYLNIEGNAVTARVEPTSTAKSGDEISVALDMNKMHLFDKETEKAILHYE